MKERLNFAQLFSDAVNDLQQNTYELHDSQNHFLSAYTIMDINDPTNLFCYEKRSFK